MKDKVLRVLSPRNQLFLSMRLPSLGQIPSTRCTTLARGRHASTNTAKPIRLEKPTKFVPPSHGRRLKEHLPRHYGPELTRTQKTEQAVKKYPNMMPPKGTFMYWLLTSRDIHTWITMGTLVLLASFTAYEQWKRDTPFKESVPAANQFLWHPLASCSQLFELWRMDVARTSAITADMRRRDIEDVQKRTTYRRRHGLESEDSQGIGGWTPREDDEILGPSLRTEGPISRGNSDVDLEGKKRPARRWFGIW
ncbi:hypothetical protein ACLMJK_005360 [Lecanora helva]